MNQEETLPSVLGNSEIETVDRRANPLALGGAALGVLLLVACLSFFLGRWSTGIRTLPELTSVSSTTVGRFGPEFKLFWEAMNLLYSDFYGKLPSNQAATHDAIRGVVERLGDQHTAFLSPEEAAVFQSNLDGQFEGIGARVDWDSKANTLRITEPFENQPAWQAGIKRGDLVLAIDGLSIIGTDLNDAVSKVRGPKGSKVVLNIRREGVAEPFDVEITRDRIETPTISTDSLGKAGEIAYVRLFIFNQNSGLLVRQAVEKALERKPRALIFDLRGNTGGLLSQAIEVTNVFTQDALVLREKFNDGRVQEHKTQNKAVDTSIPLVVLVNEGSASASEIVAGALQDSKRAMLMGSKTYGKGSVQLPHTLSDGSILKVTIARWYTPNDRTIDGTGLEPDSVVELTDEERATGGQSQIDAAVEYLNKKLGL